MSKYKYKRIFNNNLGFAVAQIVVLVGLVVITVGIFAGGKLIEIGTRYLPFAATSGSTYTCNSGNLVVIDPCYENPQNPASDGDYQVIYDLEGKVPEGATIYEAFVGLKKGQRDGTQYIEQRSSTSACNAKGSYTWDNSLGVTDKYNCKQTYLDHTKIAQAVTSGKYRIKLQRGGQVFPCDILGNTKHSLMLCVGSGPPNPTKTPAPTPTLTSGLGHNYAFVSSFTVAGNFGSLANADNICQGAATNGKLPGSYRAWLSDDKTNAKDRIPDAKFIMPDGAEIASNKADLLDGTLARPLDKNEYGQTVSGSNVWTGTDVGGNKAGNRCQEWTDTRYDGLTGQSYKAGSAWTYNFSWESGGAKYTPCDSPSRLYCFQTSDDIIIDPLEAPSDSMRVFTTSVGYTGNLGGLSGADAICQQHADSSINYRGGTFKAWLSDNSTDAKDRLETQNLPYYSYSSSDNNWIKIGDNLLDLTDTTGPDHGINFDENGTSILNSSGYAYVFTGTSHEAGRYTNQNCNNWSWNTDGTHLSRYGTAGNGRYITSWSSFDYQARCGRNYRLYCFEDSGEYAGITTPTPIPSPTSSSKITVILSPIPTLTSADSISPTPSSGEEDYLIDIGSKDSLTIHINSADTGDFPLIRFRAKLAQTQNNPDMYMKLRVKDDLAFTQNPDTQATCDDVGAGGKDFYIPVKADEAGVYMPDSSTSIFPPTDVSVARIVDGWIVLDDIVPGKYYSFVLKSPKTRGTKTAEHVILEKGQLTSQDFDWTQTPLEPGDLPDPNNGNKQNCTVNSIDLSLVEERLASTDQTSLDIADVNYDDVVNGNDISKVVNTLSTKPDDDL